MTITKSVYLFIIILGGLIEPLHAQEGPLKDFAEDRNEAKFCLYPSTLRMINLNDNQSYDEFASSIEKLLIYNLDSTTMVDASYHGMIENYRQIGFEDYVSVLGKGNTMLILGDEKSSNEMVGIVGMEDKMFAFYLRGNIAWQKIPTLFNTLNQNDLINVLDFKMN